jgi:ricin-type beta-trefoil lectin protein
VPADAGGEEEDHVSASRARAGRRRRFQLGVAAVVCALAGAASAASAAGPAVAAPRAASGRGTIYALVSKSSGKVLDANGSAHIGAPFIIYPYHGGDNQRFRLVGDSVENPNQFEIQLALPHLLYCVYGDTNGPHPPDSYLESSVGLCNGSSPEQFTAIHDPVDVLYIEFQDQANNLCLDVRGNGTANGTQVGVYECGDYQANQLWHAEKK